MPVFTPETPESPHRAAVPPPPRDGGGKGFFAWIRRTPKLAFWSTLVVALLIGIGIGASGGVSQEELDAANARARTLQSQLGDAKAASSRLSDDLEKTKKQRDTAQEGLEVATARGEVPDFTGQDIDDAKGEEAVSTYDWRVKTVRKVSDRSPGTVIAQQPREGKTLKSGRSVTLTVAKKAPPKPKQWVTLKSFSGASATKTPEFTIPEGATARLVYSMPQDGNNAIILYEAPDEYVDLMLNEIGPQSGSTRIYNPGTFYLDVSGAYDIQVQVFKRP